MQSVHKLSKLDKIDRRHSLRTTLLLLLRLIFLLGCTLTRVISPQKNQQLVGGPLQDINLHKTYKNMVLWQKYTTVGFTQIKNR